MLRGIVKRARAAELRTAATRRPVFDQFQHPLHRDLATQCPVIDPRCHAVAYPSRFFDDLEAEGRCARCAR
jgi:hypothetical protein